MKIDNWTRGIFAVLILIQVVPLEDPGVFQITNDTAMDASIGRFLTRDSKFGYINHFQTLNKYVYCLNNPLKLLILTVVNALVSLLFTP